VMLNIGRDRRTESWALKREIEEGDKWGPCWVKQGMRHELCVILGRSTHLESYRQPEENERENEAKTRRQRSYQPITLVSAGYSKSENISPGMSL